MDKISTYTDARKLAQHLAKRGVKVKPEVPDMATSGIYIPKWLGKDLPHAYDAPTKTASWYFFLRFENGYPDMNVADALGYISKHGIGALVKTIRHLEPAK